MGVRSRAVLLAAAVAALCALAPAAYGAAATVEIDSVPGQIYDVDASHILFKQSDDAFGVKDRATGLVTSIAIAADRDPRGGFLTTRGELLVTSTPSFPYAHIDERRDGPPVEDIDLGPVNALGSVRVAGDYAIWNNGTTLIRRDMSTGTQLTISSEANNWANDVTSSGEVAYSAGGSVHRYRFPIDETVGPAPGDGKHRESYPLTDGTNVVWTEHPTVGYDPDTLHGYGAAGAFSIDDTDGGDGSFAGSDYDAAGGWIAFTRGRLVLISHCCQEELRTVWVRSPDPDAVETKVSDEGRYNILALAPDGDVIYGDFYGDRYFLRRPGEDPVEIESPPQDFHFASALSRGYGDRFFKAGGNWYAAMGGSLQRISPDEAHHDGSRTQITDGPEGEDNPAHATFSFSSDGHPDATFECKLDGGDYEACPSPTTYDSLQHGQHTLAVRSVVPGDGVDTDPAIAAWIVESDPPAPTVTAPADGSFTNDSTPQLGGVAGDADGDDGTVTARLYNENESPPQLVRTLTTTRSGASWSVTVTPALPDATYSVEVDQGDAAGNQGTSTEQRTFTVDTTPPPASFATQPAMPRDDHPVTLHADVGDASGVVRFQWDLDNDGDFEHDTGATPQVTTTYHQPGDKVVGIRTTDGAGNTNVGHPGLTVYPDPPPGLVGVTINDGAQFTNDADVVIGPVWPFGATDVILSNDGGFGHAATRPLEAGVPWRLDSSGPERLPKTIYARFDPNGTTYQDDIILDETPPTLVEAEITGVGPQLSAAAARKRTYHLHVRARDRTAGVSRMQITTNRRHPGKKRRYRSRVDFRSTTAKIFVRVRDRAGNWSHWKRFER